MKVNLPQENTKELKNTKSMISLSAESLAQAFRKCDKILSKTAQLQEVGQQIIFLSIFKGFMSLTTNMHKLSHPLLSNK